MKINEIKIFSYVFRTVLIMNKHILFRIVWQKFYSSKAKTENVCINQDFLFEISVRFFFFKCKYSFCDSKEIIINNCWNIPTRFLRCLTKKCLDAKHFLWRFALIEKNATTVQHLLFSLLCKKWNVDNLLRYSFQVRRAKSTLQLSILYKCNCIFVWFSDIYLKPAYHWKKIII